MQTSQITHNNQLLGFIEYNGKHYTAIALDYEIICKTYEEAEQAIHELHETC